MSKCVNAPSPGLTAKAARRLAHRKGGARIAMICDNWGNGEMIIRLSTSKMSKCPQTQLRNSTSKFNFGVLYSIFFIPNRKIRAGAWINE